LIIRGSKVITQFGMRYLFFIGLLFLAGCTGVRETERMAILDCRITGAEMANNELKLKYTVFVTKNVKLIRIYYDWWEDGWLRLNYITYVEIPANKRKAASNNVGVSEVLGISNTKGKIRATIIASNVINRTFGSSVVKTEVLNLTEIHKKWVVNGNKANGISKDKGISLREY